jgi:hypothetical protein
VWEPGLYGESQHELEAGVGEPWGGRRRSGSDGGSGPAAKRPRLDASGDAPSWALSVAGGDPEPLTTGQEVRLAGASEAVLGEAPVVASGPPAWSGWRAGPRALPVDGDRSLLFGGIRWQTRAGIRRVAYQISKEDTFLIVDPPTGEWIRWGWTEHAPLSDFEKHMLPAAALKNDGTDIQPPVVEEDPPAKLDDHERAVKDHEREVAVGHPPRPVSVGPFRVKPPQRWAGKTVTFVISPSRGYAWAIDQGKVLDVWKIARFAPNEWRAHVPFEVEVYPGGTVATADPDIRIHVGNQRTVVIESDHEWVAVWAGNTRLVHQRWESLRAGTVQNDETVVLPAVPVDNLQAFTIADEDGYVHYTDPHGHTWTILIGRHHYLVGISHDPDNNVIFVDPAGGRVLGRLNDAPPSSPETHPGPAAIPPHG